MYLLSLSPFDEWREAARPLLARRVPPQSVEWHLPWPPRAAAGPPGSESADPASGPVTFSAPPRISASLLGLLESVALYRDAGRWEFMYRLAWRATTQNPRILEDAADHDVHRARLMERAVRRDIHKMHAFVRFREVVGEDGLRSYFAWFEPEHEILRRAAVFFVERFVNMTWTIATPDGAAVWDGRQLGFVESPDRSQHPRRDEQEDLWRTYYRSICNVARLKPAAMQREMPQRYWKHLPEAVEIGALLHEGAANFVNTQRESPDEGNIKAAAVKRAIPNPVAPGEGPQSCRRCDLWQHATQAVEGEGALPARIMLVGEQPGDEEDLRGHPFVGPAGRVLDEAIVAAGLERKDLFITNAVKHFKWEPRGKRRLHKKPGAGEVNACHVWLERDVTAAQPAVIVALGATALRALAGTTMSIEAARRETLRHPAGAYILATYHPSAILRSEGARVDELRAALIADLTKAGVLAAER